MHTQNVKTAAQETAGRWSHNPELILLNAQVSIIAELARLEGSMSMDQIESREGGKEDYEKYCNVIAAAEFVNHLETCGGITTTHIYELIKSVEALALETEMPTWLAVRNGEILSLADYQAEAPQQREAFLARVKESLLPLPQNYVVNSNRLAPVEEGHTVALLIDAEINRLVSERQWISQCDYEYREELRRLASWKAFPLMSNRSAHYGDDLLNWMRQVAQQLWENGYRVKE